MKNDPIMTKFGTLNFLIMILIKMIGPKFKLLYSMSDGRYIEKHRFGMAVDCPISRNVV